MHDVETLLVIASTHGEGDPPDNARAFYDRLHAPDAPRLDGLRYAVLALGDSNYEHFAKCGRDFDARLAELGAVRLIECVESDVDVDEPFERWKSAIYVALESGPKPAQPGAPRNGTPGRRAVSARLVANRNLCGPGADKETRHIVFASGDGDLAYEPGDAFGVVPQNCPHAIEKLVTAVGFGGDERVADGHGESVSLADALRDRYAIGKLTAPVVRAFAERSRDAVLLELCEPSNADRLRDFMYGREVIDLFSMLRGLAVSASDFVGMLGKLTPRLFSIASSPRAHPGEVHLTVAVVRYTAHNRERKGICSTFLAERIADGANVPVYVQRNARFRLPADGQGPHRHDRPGTGIAPFRAFLADRRALGNPGRNWLFLGDRTAADTFLYRDELEPMVADGHLTRLDTAFSRDQAERVYVQHRMRESARELYAWLEEGAHVYVCGDASQMAKDVDVALRHIVAGQSGRDTEHAADYVEQMRSDGRYQRDVY